MVLVPGQRAHAGSLLANSATTTCPPPSATLRKDVVELPRTQCAVKPSTALPTLEEPISGCVHAGSFHDERLNDHGTPLADVSTLSASNSESVSAGAPAVDLTVSGWPSILPPHMVPVGVPAFVTTDVAAP